MSLQPHSESISPRPRRYVRSERSAGGCRRGVPRALLLCSSCAKIAFHAFCPVTRLPSPDPCLMPLRCSEHLLLCWGSKKCFLLLPDFSVLVRCRPMPSQHRMCFEHGKYCIVQIPVWYLFSFDTISCIVRAPYALHVCGSCLRLSSVPSILLHQ